MQIAWREDLAVGVPVIDDQHKELFNRFNALVAACRAGQEREEVDRLFAFLHEYVAAHFCAEEALQQERGYPAFSDHQQQHLAFVQRLNDLHRMFYVEGSSTALVQETTSMLMAWLLDHISSSDRKIGEYLRTQPG